jgi:hypothetical protein
MATTQAEAKGFRFPIVQGLLPIMSGAADATPNLVAARLIAVVRSLDPAQRREPI